MLETTISSGLKHGTTDPGPDTEQRAHSPHMYWILKSSEYLEIQKALSL